MPSRRALGEEEPPRRTSYADASEPSYVMMELVANKHRPYVTAFLFLTTFPLSTFGPVIARTLAARTALGWRWNYYLNLIDNALAAILLYLCYYPPSYRQLHEGKSMRQQLKQLDYGGIFLFTGGLVSLVLGISWGGGLYPWKSVGVILPIVLGVCVLVLFGFYGESERPPELSVVANCVWDRGVHATHVSDCDHVHVQGPQVRIARRRGFRGNHVFLLPHRHLSPDGLFALRDQLYLDWSNVRRGWRICCVWPSYREFDESPGRNVLADPNICSPYVCLVSEP